MDYKAMSVMEMRNLPGIADLKTAVAAKFIKALKLEAEGKNDEANVALNEAVALDSK